MSARRLLRFVQAAPVTCVFLVALWTLGALTGATHGPDENLLARFGFSTTSPLWTSVTSALWAGDLTGYLASTVLLLVFGSLAERELGGLRTAGIFLGSHVLGVLLTRQLLLLELGVEWSWFDSLTEEFAATPSIGGVGLALALTFRMPRLWRRRVRLSTLVSVAVLALYSGWLEDLLRVSGALAGLLIGALCLRERAAGQAARTRAETRVLVALLVAASALGPVVALLSPFPHGPLSWYSDVVALAQPTPDEVVAACAWDGEQACRTARVQLSYGRFPALVMSLLPALLLLVLAEGLRRGRRFAWRAALVCESAHAAIIGWHVLDDARVPEVDRFELVFSYGVPVLGPVAVVLVLLATRTCFTARLPDRAARGLRRAVLGSGMALSALYVLGGFLVRERFTPSPGLGGLLADLPTRFLPPGYLSGLVEARFTPDGFVATALFEHVGVVFWLVVLAGSLTASWRTWPVVDEWDGAHARELLRRHGGSSLSHLTTWSGNRYWFSRDRQTVIAYRVVATVALTVGDPIGPAGAGAVRDFAAFCQDNGWTPCLYSVGTGTRDAARELGWSSVQVAEDAVVELGSLSFTGKKWQDVRTALNKADRAGITAEWCEFTDLPPGITDQIRSISAQWLSDKGLPELGFTLGGVAELAGEGVRCLIAVDQDRTVHGVTSWLPVRAANGEVVGWTLDFTRRRAQGFRGTSEFLIASAALRAQEEGARFLSLSGAPLARLDRGERPRASQRLLDLAGRALEPVYGFRSLFAFKSKFQPVYRPLFMTYPDPAALPTIANAVSRAYLPRLSGRQVVRLAVAMVRRG
ncbi:MULTISPECIES: DUF2156 domain-containing protein [Actinosynnema]|uniref:phosphatidylglycerol lysyltransferase domain-containing protein n=1 Tax=Actinosynnema TaxID=40566 RepID=UPI0020A43D8F|nr:DUF2156 domain-containing protein [Actinosynnema pretiosum]MCP2098807.1 Lysylphosphatidylglycerol synthetase, C-terminal domain, DUF2156 family [Actinosynnema pretiosum]